MPAADPQDQPLENRHACTLIRVLQAHTELNVLGASWVLEASGPSLPAAPSGKPS